MIAFAAKIQKLIMANNIERAIKLTNAENVPVTRSIRELLYSCRRVHELDLICEEGRVETEKYNRWMLFGWLGLLVAALNPILALIAAYSIADGGPFVLGNVLSMLGAYLCYNLMIKHNLLGASSVYVLTKVRNLLHARARGSLHTRGYGHDAGSKAYIPPHLACRKIGDEEAGALRRSIDADDEPERAYKQEEEPSFSEEPLPKPNPKPTRSSGILEDL